MYLKSLAGALVALSLAACGGGGRAELVPVEGDAFLGSADAKVVVLEYGSPTCPACKNWHDTYFPDLKRDYVDTNKVKFVWREFAIHGAIDAGIFSIARCAGATDFFPVLDEAFARQQSIVDASIKGKSIEALNSLGEKFQLSADQVKSCMADKTIVRRINDVSADAQNKGIDSTPTFVVNGVVMETSDPAAITAAIEAALSGAPIPAQTAPAPIPGDDGHGHAPGETH
jgi:protein-disulfide isomerase